MNLTSVTALATTTLGDFGDNVLIVLTAIIGVAIAYFLFGWAYSQIMWSVTQRRINRSGGWDYMSYRKHNRKGHDQDSIARSYGFKSQADFQRKYRR